MDIYSGIWSIVESTVFFVLVIVFFLDPVRRWNFFGYRPTAVTVVFDPVLEKVLLSKSNDAWSFNQGGMYESNIYLTVNDILKRELNISENRCRILYSRSMGTVRIPNRGIPRTRITTFSLFPHLRGKGYMACFMQGNLANIESEITKGPGITDVKVVPLPEALYLINQCNTHEHQAKKRAMLADVLNETEKLIANIQKAGKEQ